MTEKAEAQYENDFTEVDPEASETSATLEETTIDSKEDEVEELASQDLSEVEEEKTSEKTSEDESIEQAHTKTKDKLLTDLSANLLIHTEEIKNIQQQILQEFNTKLKYDEHKESLIDKLHSELQQYKADMIKSSMLPMIRDLIMVNDNILKLVDNYRAIDEPLDGEEILNHLEAVTIDIDDVLFRQGVESYTLTEDKVEHLKQTIFQTVKTADQSKERHIAKRLRKGYQWDEQTIRKELVSVYVYDEAMKDEQDEENQGDDTNDK